MKRVARVLLKGMCNLVYEGKPERACSGVPSSLKRHLVSVEMAVLVMFKKENFLKG